MNLLKYLEHVNKYNNLGWIAPGWTLFEIFKNNQIFHQNNIDLVIAFIRSSSLEETLLLANVDADRLKTIEHVLETSWFTLHLEDKVKNMTSPDDEFNRLILGEPEVSEAQEKLFASEDEDEDEDENDEIIEEAEEDDDDEDEDEDEDDGE